MGRHLIHRQTLDLRYSNAAQARMDMDRWGVWYQQELLPVIAEVLDEVEIPGKTIRLDRLELDLGEISRKADPDILQKRLRDALKDQIQRQFPELIRTHPPSTSPSLFQNRLPDEQKELEQWAYLLDKGRQPWWALSSQKAGIRHFFQKLFREEKNPSLKQWLESRPLSSRACQRLAHHLAYSELMELAIWTFPEKKQAWQLFFKSLEETLIPEIFTKSDFDKLLAKILAEVFFAEKVGPISAISTWVRSVLVDSSTVELKKSEVFSPILALFAGRNLSVWSKSTFLSVSEKWVKSRFLTVYSDPSDWKENEKKKLIIEEFQQELSKRLGGKVAAKQDLQTPSARKPHTIQQLKTDETFPISNSGLVLAAPFLPYFFSGLGLVEKKEFVSKESQHRSALLIQAFLDESYNYEECDLLLNKILCGVPPDEPIPLSFSLTELEKEEIPNLLNAMAQQWTALRSTSGTALAKGFFPREGSLRRTDKGYQLTIPRVSIDILLDRLPWAVSIIKLHWMDETLFVEW